MEKRARESATRNRIADRMPFAQMMKYLATQAGGAFILGQIKQYFTHYFKEYRLCLDNKPSLLGQPLDFTDNGAEKRASQIRCCRRTHSRVRRQHRVKLSI
ncbi:hypothetical protein [Methylomicrobium agile]|uniref:hypothetical protein n=1 Tax=Methylomicrobium agile TaxID=39774 RepID=UPI0002623D95|nr:hypothetical protein [Methylomicrobium agile]